MKDKNINSAKNLEIGSLAAILCMLVDQIHKFVMLEVYGFEKLAEPLKITEFFNLVMVWNRGISFGMFQGMEYSNYFFMGLTVVIILAIFAMIKYSKHKYEVIAFGMIIGGACGNLIDRIRMGAVADFFDVHYKQHHWPAFNIADSCVFIGAVILIVCSLFKRDASAGASVRIKSKGIKNEK